MTLPAIETYVYEKNRRYEVDKGTRCATAVVEFDPRVEKDALKFADEAQRKCAEAWFKEWGPIPWNEVQMLTSFFTAQVICELRVPEQAEPNTWWR